MAHACPGSIGTTTARRQRPAFARSFTTIVRRIWTATEADRRSPVRARSTSTYPALDDAAANEIARSAVGGFKPGGHRVGDTADMPTTPERTVAKTLSSGEFRCHVRGTGRRSGRRSGPRSDRLAASADGVIERYCAHRSARSLRASGPVGIADRLHAPSMGVGLSHFRVPADLFGALAVYRTASSRAALLSSLRSDRKRNALPDRSVCTRRRWRTPAAKPIGRVDA